MKIPYPKTVQVGGKTYTVKVDPHLMVHEGNIKGMCDHATLTISVQSGNPSDGMTETLIHEMCHAVDATYCAGDITEKDLDSLSEGLFQVWKQLGIEVIWDVA